MNTTKDKEFHHHIAQAYLRGFKKENTPLYCFKENEQIEEISLTNKILGEMNFYTNETEIFLNKFETLFAKYRDCMTSEIEDKIKNNIEDFSMILSVFFLRTLYQRNFWIEQTDLIIKHNIQIPVPSNLILKNIQYQIMVELGLIEQFPENIMVFVEPPLKKDELWESLLRATFEAELTKEDNKLIKFIKKSLEKNNFQIILNNNNFLTTENPVIILDKKGIPIKFILSQNIENVFFILNSEIAIYFYEEKFQPIGNYLELIKELLSKKYSKYVISGSREEINNLKKVIKNDK